MERLDPLQDVEVGLLGDVLGGGQREPADEDGKAREELLLLRLEEVVAPLDCPAERPLPLGEAGARCRPQKIEPRAETLEHGAGGKEIAACRGELERQRQTVEPNAELAHRLGVRLGELEVGPGGPGAVDEQPDRLDPAQLRKRETLRPIRQLQRRHRIDPFLRHPERGAARDEQLHAGCAGQQLSQERGSVEHVLEVVEQQQRLPLAQVLEQAPPEPSVPAVPSPRARWRSPSRRVPRR